jgi:predicted dehydrogenase
MKSIRVGIVGLGENTRVRHVPGLRACRNVEIVGVCNRTRESSERAAEVHGIPRAFASWRELVEDNQVDAVVIGTWPSLHAEVTIAALEAEKHVLTEARMACNAEQARRMLEASRRHPELVAQIVPSPFGLRVDRVVREWMDSQRIGQLQEVVVLGVTNAWADRDAPIHWRQRTEHSGMNVLTLGILHETVIRWVPDPKRVMAMGSIFTAERPDPNSGEPASVDVPDVLHILTELPGGARGLYHFSGVAHGGPGLRIDLYGSDGSLRLTPGPTEREEKLWGLARGEKVWREIPIPPEKEGGWRVEAEFIGAIRGEEPVRFTDFSTGVRYMEFTDAVARSRESGKPVDVSNLLS